MVAGDGAMADKVNAALFAPSHDLQE